MKAAIFDMDGTLLNSIGMWRSLAPSFCRLKNIPWTDELEKATMNMGFFNSAEYYKENFPQLEMSIDDLIWEWVKMAQNCYQNTVFPKSGAISYLNKLKNDGIPCAVATMSYHILSDNALSRHGIDKLVDFVLTPEDVNGIGKESPDLFLKAAEKLGFAPAECVVFEDSLIPIKTALNAGFKVCALSEPLRSVQDALEIKSISNRLITDFTELLQE